MNFPSHVSSEFIDLMGRIFKYDPEERLTAREILEDPYFSRIELKADKISSDLDHLQTTARSQTENKLN